MSIFGCNPSTVPDESKDKEALAPTEEQIKAVSTMINGLRERVAELTTECNARLGSCAARVVEMERRLHKITGPLESKSSEELHRVLYILELIKRSLSRKRKERRVT